MTAPLNCVLEGTDTSPGRLGAGLTAAISFLRGVPLFASGRPLMIQADGNLLLWNVIGTARRWISDGARYEECHELEGTWLRGILRHRYT